MVKIIQLKNLLVKKKIYLLVAFILGLIADIFFNPRIADWIVVVLIGLWLINIINFKIKPKQTLILAIATYLIAFVFQFFGKEMIMEKGASWCLIFLVIAIGQWLIKAFFKNEKKA